MLADATRVRIVMALRDAGELPVGQLAEIVGKTPAGVSQHLAKLRLARIVATRQDGNRVFYRLENEHAQQLVADAVFQAEHSLGGLPAHHHHDDAHRDTTSALPVGGRGAHRSHGAGPGANGAPAPGPHR